MKGAKYAPFSPTSLPIVEYMETKILAQITSDGFIARCDGKRDWYLDPDIYGISDFFTAAAATFGHQDGRCRVELRSGEAFFWDKPGSIPASLGSGPGYVAVEAVPQTLSLIQNLLSRGLIDELHLIRIPVRLHEGIHSPALSEIESAWPSTGEKKMDQISYTVFCCPQDEKEETV